MEKALQSFHLPLYANVKVQKDKHNEIQRKAYRSLNGNKKFCKWNSTQRLKDTKLKSVNKRM